MILRDSVVYGEYNTGWDGSTANANAMATFINDTIQTGEFVFIVAAGDNENYMNNAYSALYTLGLDVSVTFSNC